MTDELREALEMADRWEGQTIQGLPAGNALNAALTLGRAYRAVVAERDEARRRTGVLDDKDIWQWKSRAEAAEKRVADLEVEVETENRVMNDMSRACTLQSERAEAAESALALARSCICHRIPSRDWHLDRCPAKAEPKIAALTAQVEKPEATAGKVCANCGRKWNADGDLVAGPQLYPCPVCRPADRKGE